MSHTVAEGPDPLLGKKIADRYTIMRRIARGGMGVVYLAVQEPLGRAVALKVIRADHAADDVMQKRFEREAKAVSQLAHPNIVTVFDYGRTADGALFLAMELVEGETLREVLKRRGRLPALDALAVMEAILAALTRAHAAGIVHRDLKPENIMLPRASGSTAGTVVAKVLDFGLAKPHDPQLVADNITQAGGFVGTPGYAAPEQAQGEPEHPRQDLYALGVVWWEMLTGAHPFAAPTPMKMVTRQLTEEAPHAPSLDGLSSPYASLLRRLLARNADERPTDALAVVEELRRARAHAPTPLPGGALPVVVSAEAETMAARPTSTTRAADAPADARSVPLAATPLPPSTALESAPSTSAGRVSAGPTLSLIDGPRRTVPLILAAAAAAFVGAVVAVVASRVGDEAVGDVVTDAGAAVVEAAPVDAGPPRVELVLRGVPRFVAVHQLVQSVEGAVLERYTADESLVTLAGADAAARADTLQGRALATPTPLVLEVVEVAGLRVVMRAVPPEEASALADAGPGALDAGPVDAVVAPGGLDP